MRWRETRAGLTLIELIVAFSILLILSTMALPVARVRVQREKERQLRDALTEMRKAIDRYKDYADAGKLGQVDPDTQGYPENLEMLVEGVTVTDNTGPGAFGSMPGGMGSNPGNQRSGFGQSSNRASSSSRRGGAFGGGSSGFGSSGSGGFGQSGGSQGSDEEQKIRFLRRVPVDPMTGTTDWGLRSVQDSPDSMSWGGRNVFDVYSQSMETALDGTRYSEW